MPRASIAPCAVRSPANITILRELEMRRVPVRRAVGESDDEFESRLETKVMALFRDERDELAFQALYEMTRESLLEWISGLLHARCTADPLEVLQDTFVNVYRYAGSFRDEQPRSFRVWSRTIAGNLVRRRTRRMREPSWQALPDGAHEPADQRQGPPGLLVRDEQQRCVLGAWMIVLSQYASAYRELCARDRMALDLIEVQGLSYSEAGARLCVGLSNMKMIMFRARRRLRARIAVALDRRQAVESRVAG
jgi:RNA polymerase sigma factor (sigma-70 family)